MTVLVYGAGAVGLGIASCLARSGAAVHLVARPETAEALRMHGLVRTGIFGEHRVSPAELGVHTTVDTAPRTGLDYVIVATKSFDTEQAARALSRLPGCLEARHVLFQNGWGNVETYSAHVRPERVFAARVITGFTRPSLHEVRITVHAEEIHIGSFRRGCDEEAADLADAISRGGIPCATTPHIARDLWSKMLYNCALNSLGAVFEVTYGELAAQPESRRIMDAVITEIYGVMHAAGFETHWRTPEEYLRTFYGTLVPRTAAHESSTLQDIRARKRTEIEALNGAVVRLAERHGAPAPLNALLADMVRFKEQKGTEPSPAASGPSSHRTTS